MLPLLIEISHAIRAQAPNMTIRMIDLGSPLKAADVLEDGGADLVLTLQAAPLSPQINTATLYKTGHLCFYDPTCTTAPETLEQFLAAPHGVLDFGRKADSILGVALREQGLHRDIKLAAANSFVLAALMRGTPAIATLPEPLAQTSFAGFASVRPPKALDLQPVTCRMLWHRRIDASGKHLWLSDVIREAAATI
jgi:DNA-binding transcriptional LysR family regulator